MVDALISVVLNNLKSTLSEEMKLLVGVPDGLELMSSTFTAIQAVLEDANQRQLKDRSVLDWINKLKDLAYEVDDVLDDWSSHALRKKVTNQFPSLYWVSEIILRHKIGTRIRDLNIRLSQIANEKKNYHLRENLMNERPDRTTISLVNESDIFGRDLDKIILRNELLGEGGPGSDGVVVVSIVGMGGLGKTTLAKLVYNDEMVMSSFAVRMWVCVSDGFDLKRILKAIIEGADRDADPERLDTFELETLQRRLGRSLIGKKFLLVLDDVWDEDYEKWETLWQILGKGAKGSRIVVTTRNLHIADMVGTTFMHRLEVLSMEDCWSMFSKRAFIGKSREEYLELEAIGREIVQRCKGLPLAVKAVGSVLRFKRTKRAWEAFVENEMWALSDAETTILPPLLLSYYDLHPYLKQCFAYCSIFPKDWKIEKEKVTKLWMAQGYICTEGPSFLEEKSAEYFDQLLDRSLFQEPVTDDNGNVVACKMHDLVHDLAVYVAKGECTIITNKTDMHPYKVRHSSCTDSVVSSTLLFMKNLRTMMFIKGLKTSSLPDQLFSELKHLRAIDLSYSKIRSIPRSIGELNHLRFLDLSGTYIAELPVTVTSLCSLQLLKLSRCKLLESLPVRIGEMISLRHLEFDTTLVDFLPCGIGRLHSLQTLTMFIVGGETSCKIGELKELNLLKGKLEIRYLERIASKEEAIEAKLEDKKHLLALELCFNDGRSNEMEPLEVETDTDRIEAIFECLKPNVNLKELKILNHIANRLPCWMEDPAFSNVVRLEIEGCKCRQLPGLGRLPALKYLEICSISELKYLGGEFYGRQQAFPKLEQLTLYDLPNWEEWKLNGEQTDGALPCLSTLTLKYCPKLKALPPVLPETLVTLTIAHCDIMVWTPLRPSFIESLDITKKLEMLSSLLSGSNISNLKHLKICGYGEKQASMPEGLQELKQLESIEIESWLTLAALPDDLLHLKALRNLVIRCCPLLRERCKKEGQDWNKIAHVSNIKIDDKAVQCQI